MSATREYGPSSERSSRLRCSESTACACDLCRVAMYLFHTDGAPGASRCGGTFGVPQRRSVHDVRDVASGRVPPATPPDILGRHHPAPGRVGRWHVCVLNASVRECKKNGVRLTWSTHLRSDDVGVWVCLGRVVTFVTFFNSAPLRPALCTLGACTSKCNFAEMCP